MRPQIIHYHLFDFPQISWTGWRYVSHLCGSLMLATDMLVAVALQYVTLGRKTVKRKVQLALLRGETLNQPVPDSITTENTSSGDARAKGLQ